MRRERVLSHREVALGLPLLLMPSSGIGQFPGNPVYPGDLEDTCTNEITVNIAAVLSIIVSGQNKRLRVREKFSLHYLSINLNF